METVKRFIDEVRIFSRKNWWIYGIYLSLLLLIILQGEGIVEVTLITLIHFIADIFIMMMISAYGQQQYSKGSRYQVVSMILFIALKIYTGWERHDWHYFAADPLYLLAAIKNYQLDVKNKDIQIINIKTMSLLAILIVFGVLVPGNILNSTAQWIQTFGIFLFAIALGSPENKVLQFQLSIVALTAMVGGSAWETANTLQRKEISGLALSYTLLPLTVLVFYLKTWTRNLNSASLG